MAELNPDEFIEKDILLAEDDADDLEIFKSALDELGLKYELRCAENGDMLLVLLEERIPYILFLDIQMPCKDGIACIREIRQDRRYDSLPVIMYTSFFRDIYVKESFRTGANYFVTKPNNFAELVAKLRKIFAIDWRNYLHYPTYDDFLIN
jgi:CheY-like chemotaxis protein